MPRRTLTELQEAFAQEYVRADLNPVKTPGWGREVLRTAQRSVGGACTANDKTASEKASKMLSHPKVAARIRALRDVVATVALDAQAEAEAESKPAPQTIVVPGIEEPMPTPIKVIEGAAEIANRYAFDTSVRATLTELACVGMADPRGLFDEAGNLLDLKDMPEHLARAVSSIKVHRQRGQDGSQTRAETVEIKFWPKVEALRLIGQHRRMFVELHENGAANEFAHMTDEQIDAELARYAALDAIERAQRPVKAKATEGGDR